MGTNGPLVSSVTSRLCALYSRASQIIANVLLWICTFIILTVFIPFTFSELGVKICQETDNSTWEMLGIGIESRPAVFALASLGGLFVGLVFSVGVSLGLAIFYADFRLK